MTTTTRSTKDTAGKPAKSIEEKKAQAEALHASISDQVEQLRNTERWAAFLDFATAFHTYSLNNLLLILAQKPEASRVAGFRKWQTLGRQVRKGETGIRIFGYSTKKITEDDDNGEAQEKRVARFPILSVFDISQTDPAEGAPDATALTEQLTGTADFGVTTALTAHLISDGWTVSYRSLPGTMNGYADAAEMSVVLDVNLSTEHRAKTLIHETAHILMDHTGDPAEYAEHRGLMETEAESVAYVVAGLVGFDTSAYSIGYIAGWADANTDMIKSAAARVLRTAHQIAAILDTENDSAADNSAEDAAE
ncbi:ArdC-like ssDNA-binding domain-containing protein [Subtercola vilae]|uniref:DUF1738 domain-containing protein n=1 Tax=Subtercola vilae TaxID=2056433 RepID=A0A4T2C229_9MICO|nr:ArdC-like ssDNA-binding domain-containing protein [Subtercola vilae]TIH36148.1 DUF1738 domain-containing protein [Subtercola vilae]